MFQPTTTTTAAPTPAGNGNGGSGELTPPSNTTNDTTPAPSGPVCNPNLEIQVADPCLPFVTTIDGCLIKFTVPMDTTADKNEVFFDARNAKPFPANTLVVYYDKICMYELFQLSQFSFQ